MFTKTLGVLAFCAFAFSASANEDQLIDLLKPDGSTYKLTLREVRERAEAGNADFAGMWGFYLSNGFYVSKNIPEAVKFLTKAAEGGDYASKWRLGEIYFKGEEISRDYWKAMNLLIEVAELKEDGHYVADSRFMIGMMHYQECTYFPSDTIRFDECGDELGVTGIAKNYKVAHRWFERAAELNDRNAQLALGTMFEHGRGVLQDFERAEKLYKLAAQNGRREGLLFLGPLHLRRGDKIGAYAWMSVAAAADYSESSAVAKERDKLAHTLTSSELKKGQALAREFWKMHEQNSYR